MLCLIASFSKNFTIFASFIEMLQKPKMFWKSFYFRFQIVTNNVLPLKETEYKQVWPAKDSLPMCNEALQK